MKLGIMQPYFFPYVGYFQLLAAVDKFVFYDDVAFIKQGWINRNRILVQGAPCFITVPVKAPSSFRSIHETEVAGDAAGPWRTKLLKTLHQAYAKAPCFAEVFALARAVIEPPEPLVSRLASRSVRAVCEYLDIETPLVEASACGYPKELKAQDRVLAICRQEGCADYLNASGGAALYAREAFAAQGVRLQFLQPRAVSYRQFREAFVPALSILDVLMFNPKKEARALLSAFDLV